MTSPDALGSALTLAFLAGPWTQAGLVARGEQVLGERPRWLTPLARELLGRFAEPPNDADRTLREAIASARSFKRGTAAGKPRACLRTLLVSQPSMGLCRWPVPALCTTTDIAAWLGTSASSLDWFADVRGLNGEVTAPALLHYAFQWLPKRRGGYRLVEAPKTRLKGLQRRILHEVLQHVPAHDAAHGFVAGRSVLTCARMHSAHSVVLRMDLEDYFPSIGAPRIYRVFRSIGYPETVAQVLTGLCTVKVSARVLDTMPGPSFVEHYDPDALAERARNRSRLRHRHLAQGAPTSPALANLASYRLDARLAGAAKSVGASYTRYADDLAFSGDVGFRRETRHLEAMVGAIALEEGFDVNHHKTRVMLESQRQHMLGLVTNQRPNVPRRTRERLEAILTNAVKHGLASQNRDASPNFLESLRSQVAWVAQANPNHARKLGRLLEACEAQ